LLSYVADNSVFALRALKNFQDRGCESFMLHDQDATRIIAFRDHALACGVRFALAAATH
jgi:hypothetical protein